MARDIGNAQILGYVGNKRDMRFTPSGTEVTDFTVAVNRRSRGSQGETDETDWYRIVCWGKLAELADQFVEQGSRVYVDGRLQIRRFTTNEGVERTSVEVVARDIVFLSSRNNPEGGMPGGGSYRESAPSEPREASRGGRGRDDEDEFDDVPF
ncbi:MAG TPA: single-stranded DNA-binding protein [Nitrolancea sp.]